MQAQSEAVTVKHHQANQTMPFPGPEGGGTGDGGTGEGGEEDSLSMGRCGGLGMRMECASCMNTLRSCVCALTHASTLRSGIHCDHACITLRSTFIALKTHSKINTWNSVFSILFHLPNELATSTRSKKCLLHALAHSSTMPSQLNCSQKNITSMLLHSAERNRKRSSRSSTSSEEIQSVFNNPTDLLLGDRHHPRLMDPPPADPHRWKTC